jgi:hypothetical protein
MWLNVLDHLLDMVSLPQFGRQGEGGMNFVSNKVHYLGEMVQPFSVSFWGGSLSIRLSKTHGLRNEM